MDKKRIEDILCHKDIWMIGKSDETYRAFLSHLHNRDLSGLSLAGVDLEGANLEGCNLAATTLKGANLRGVKLKGCNLLGTDFRGADLTGADLSGAVVTSCDFRKADCNDIKTEGAIIKTTDLRGASGNIDRLANTVEFSLPENMYEEVWPEAIQQSIEETRKEIERERLERENSEREAIEKLAVKYSEEAKAAEEEKRSEASKRIEKEDFEKYLINNAFELAKKYRTDSDSDPLDELVKEGASGGDEAELAKVAPATEIEKAESPAEVARRNAAAPKRRKLK